MPRTYQVEPRFKVRGVMQVFEIPKKFDVVYLERHGGDGTLRLICKKRVTVKAKVIKKAKQVAERVKVEVKKAKDEVVKQVGNSTGGVIIVKAKTGYK